MSATNSNGSVTNFARKVRYSNEELNREKHFCEIFLALVEVNLLLSFSVFLLLVYQF